MELEARIHLSRLLAIALYFLLLASLVAGQLVSDTLNSGVLAIQLAPLLILLPGLIKGNTKTHVWLGCVLLFYSSKFISDIIVTHGSWLSILQTSCGIALFVAATLYVHWQWKQKTN